MSVFISSSLLKVAAPPIQQQYQQQLSAQENLSPEKKSLEKPSTLSGKQVSNFLAFSGISGARSFVHDSDDSDEDSDDSDNESEEDAENTSPTKDGSTGEDSVEENYTPQFVKLPPRSHIPSALARAWDRRPINPLQSRLVANLVVKYEHLISFQPFMERYHCFPYVTEFKFPINMWINEHLENRGARQRRQQQQLEAQEKEVPEEEMKDSKATEVCQESLAGDSATNQGCGEDACLSSNTPNEAEVLNLSCHNNNNTNDFNKSNNNNHNTLQNKTTTSFLSCSGAEEDPTDPFISGSLFAPLSDIALSDAPPSLVIDGDSSTSSSEDAEDDVDKYGSDDDDDDDNAFGITCLGQRNRIVSSLDIETAAATVIVDTCGGSEDDDDDGNNVAADAGVQIMALHHYVAAPKKDALTTDSRGVGVRALVNSGSTNSGHKTKGNGEDGRPVSILASPHTCNNYRHSNKKRARIYTCVQQLGTSHDNYSDTVEQRSPSSGEAEPDFAFASQAVASRNSDMARQDEQYAMGSFAGAVFAIDPQLMGGNSNKASLESAFEEKRQDAAWQLNVLSRIAPERRIVYDSDFEAEEDDDEANDNGEGGEDAGYAYAASKTVPFSSGTGPAIPPRNRSWMKIKSEIADSYCLIEPSRQNVSVSRGEEIHSIQEDDSLSMSSSPGLSNTEYAGKARSVTISKAIRQFVGRLKSTQSGAISPPLNRSSAAVTTDNSFLLVSEQV